MQCIVQAIRAVRHSVSTYMWTLDIMIDYMVQLNFNLGRTCTILASVSLILWGTHEKLVCHSILLERIRVIQLLSNLFVGKFNKCQSHLEHKYKNLKTLLNTTLTYIHPSFVQCTLRLGDIPIISISAIFSPSAHIILLRIINYYFSYIPLI